MPYLSGMSASTLFMNTQIIMLTRALLMIKNQFEENERMNDGSILFYFNVFILLWI
jgi:hypothetical protein